jgi:trans-2,3-dihydro-3-hydroxyanthranilate isomerase
MTTHEYVIADVFTDTPLEGNQLAVFTDARGLDAEQMQSTAREMRLAETVFVFPDAEDADARIRIFTPLTELPFAGHPVLGTGFVLADGAAIRLKTEAGTVTVQLNGDHTYGEMERPVPEAEQFEAPDELLQALGTSDPQLPIEAYRNGPRHVYVALQEVASLTPDMGALTRLGSIGVNCFELVGPDQVHTRMFAPALGVPEDAATGSAAGPLALHLMRHGQAAAGQQLKIRQGIEIGRPSTLYARVEDDPPRIVVGGSAVIVARGTYRLA